MRWRERELPLTCICSTSVRARDTCVKDALAGDDRVGRASPPVSARWCRSAFSADIFSSSATHACTARHTYIAHPRSIDNSKDSDLLAAEGFDSDAGTHLFQALQMDITQRGHVLS